MRGFISGLSILFKLLSLGYPFCILAVCGVLFIVEFPCCVWVCTGGLVRKACVGVLVGGAGFLPSGVPMKCPVMSYEMSMNL